jgi:probable rRNA maturation factor
MILLFEINNKTRFKIKKSLFEKAAKEKLKEVRIRRKSISISLALVDKKTAQKLNLIYRDRRYVPEVLSFVWNERRPEIKPKGIFKGKFLGEVVLCPTEVKKVALKNKEDLSSRLVSLFIHGLLHLLGYKHSAKEFELEK